MLLFGMSTCLQYTLRQLAKRGCHNSLRPAVWSRILCADSLDVDQEARFDALLADVKRRGYATDDWFLFDARTVCDDHNFFPFLEVVQVGASIGGLWTASSVAWVC